MFGGLILPAGRCLFLLDVEGATGQGASLVFTSGPPLHLVQLAAAAFEKALAKNKKKNKLSFGYTSCITQLLFAAD